MDSLLWFAVLSFATYRVAWLLTNEEGPFEIALRWRNLFSPENWIGRGVRCVYCVSFWIGIVAGLWHFGLSLDGLIFGLGVAGFAILINRL